MDDVHTMDQVAANEEVIEEVTPKTVGSIPVVPTDSTIDDQQQ